MSETNTRLYELGFILVPTTPETEVPAKVDAFKSLVTKLEGVITAEGNPEFIDLAYTMEKTVGSKKSKYSQGYFGWIKFEAAPDTLVALKKALDGEADLIRYILIKTNAANTIVFKKPKVEPKRESNQLEELLEEGDIEEDGSVDDESLDHERLPAVEEDMTVDETLDNASEKDAA